MVLIGIKAAMGAIAVGLKGLGPLRDAKRT